MVEVLFVAWVVISAAWFALTFGCYVVRRCESDRKFVGELLSIRGGSIVRPSMNIRVMKALGQLYSVKHYSRLSAEMLSQALIDAGV